jgi:multisubunit Na+/H+ antiporter MnhF subunit
VIEASFLLLVAAGACYGYRMFAGPTMADRAVGLNGLVVAGMIGICLHAIATGIGSFLPVLVVLSLVGFLGTAMVARYIESRGQ